MRRTFATLACPLGLTLAVLVMGAGPDVPKAVVAWPSGPIEARVAFDAPLSESGLKHWSAGRIEVVRAGAESQTPLGALRIAGARLEDHGRTLVLNTDPHPINARYRVVLPERVAAYDLGGIEVEWRNAAAEVEGEPTGFKGWWPMLDADRARVATQGSVSHERGFRLLETPGVLTLRALLMLPAGKGTVRIQTSGKLQEAAIANELTEPAEGVQDRIEIAVESSGEPLDFLLTIATGSAPGPFTLRGSYQGESDAQPEPLQASAFQLPWGPTPPAASAVAAPLPEILNGGDARRGEAVFFSEEARCGSCHRIAEKGSAVGPDLTVSLPGRDRAAIQRDIIEPSAVIAPDYVPFTVSLRDGQVLAGIARAEGPDAIKVVDTNAKAVIVPRSDIEEIRPSGTSIMPVGLAGALGETRLRDLLAYLAEIADRKPAKP